MSKTMDLLKQEHVNTAQLLNIIDRQLAKFDQGERPDYELIEAIVEYFREFPMESHHPKEDMVFRRLVEIEPSIVDETGDLSEEHESLAKGLAGFADAVDQVLGQGMMGREEFHAAANGFLERERAHMAMEEQTFFPAALRVLSEQDWIEIDKVAANPSDPVFGDANQAKYQALRDEILEWEKETAI